MTTVFDAYHLDPRAEKTAVNMSIPSLCAHVDGSKAVASSPIRSVEWKKEDHGVQHEFLIVEYHYFASTLDGAEPKPIQSFIRLDRGARNYHEGDARHVRPRLLSRSSSGLPVSDTVCSSPVSYRDVDH